MGNASIVMSKESSTEMDRLGMGGEKAQTNLESNAGRKKDGKVLINGFAPV